MGTRALHAIDPQVPIQIVMDNGNVELAGVVIGKSHSHRPVRSRASSKVKSNLMIDSKSGKRMQ
jgi:hypothetical protein